MTAFWILFGLIHLITYVWHISIAIDDSYYYKGPRWTFIFYTISSVLPISTVWRLISKIKEDDKISFTDWLNEDIRY